MPEDDEEAFFRDAATDDGELATETAGDDGPGLEETLTGDGDEDSEAIAEGTAEDGEGSALDAFADTELLGEIALELGAIEERLGGDAGELDGGDASEGSDTAEDGATELA